MAPCTMPSYGARNSINLSFIIYILLDSCMGKDRRLNTKTSSQKDHFTAQRSEWDLIYTYNLLLSKSDFPFTYDNVK